MSKTVTVIQTRSTIGHKSKHERTLEALGLGRIGKEKELPVNRSVLGMLRSVHHLVEVRHN